jgi:hypothetical protein
MYPSTEIIKDLLETLVSPQFDGIEDYIISYDKHDDTGETWVMVDVIFNKEDYNRQSIEKRYFSFFDFDYDVIDAVKKCLRYLNLNKVAVINYVIE